MRYCKPVTVYFEIRGSTKVGVISERMQGPDHLLGRRWTHYVGNRSNLKAVEKARISHSDDVTSSNALLNQWPRGFWESSFFSEVEVAAMDRRKLLRGLQSAGNGRRERQQLKVKRCLKFNYYTVHNLVSSLLLPHSTDNLCNPSFVRSFI